MRFTEYLLTTDGIIWTVACLPLAFLMIFVSYLLFNKFPAKWYCDYDEEPSEELLGRRVSYKGSGIVLSVITAVCFAACRLQYNKGYDILFASLSLAIIVLLMIAVSDFKYTIIPDQFTVALAVIFLLVVVYDRLRGYNIFSSSWWQPLVGAAIGGGVMLLINALGVIIYKKEGMGFGDVKLFAAVGILTGFPGTLYTILISLVVACVGFAVTFIVGRITMRASDTDDDTDDDTDEDTDEDTDDGTAERLEASGADDAEPAGRYLAFGPYIAIGTIIYICLFDMVNSMAGWYLSMFN